MSVDGSIILDTRVDTSGINKGISSIKGSLSGLAKSVGLAFGINSILNFAKSSIQLASDLQEVQNVVDVVFGESSEKVNQFAKNAINSYGLSELSAKKFASTMGAMLSSMGLTEDAVLDMSLSLTALAGDMASFNNLRPEEAFEKIRSGISGETEPLKQLGIDLSVANLEAFALSQGITKSYNSMTRAEQALLRYNYLLYSTSNAQGDFARTSGSWANQVRKLSEKWDMFKTAIGETLIMMLDAFMPAIEKVIEGLVIIGLYIAAFARGMRGTKKEVEETGQKTQTLGANAKITTNAIKGTTGAVKSLGEATKKTNKQLAQFDDLMVLQTATANNIDTGAGIGGGGLSGGFGDISIPNYAADASAIEGLIDSETLQKIDEFETWVSENSEDIKTALEVAGWAILIGIIGKTISKIGKLLGVFGKKDTALQTQTGYTWAETAAVAAMATAFVAVPKLAENMGSSIGDLSGVAVHDLVPALSGVSSTATSVLSPALSGLAILNNEEVSPSFFGVAEQALGTVPAFSSVFQSALNLERQMGLSMPAIDGFVTVASKNMKTNLGSFFDYVQTTLPTWTSSVVPNFRNAFQEMVDCVYLGSKNMADNMYEALSNMGRNLADFLNTSVEGVVSWVNKSATDIRNFSINIAKNVNNAFNSMWGSVTNLLELAGIGFKKAVNWGFTPEGISFGTKATIVAGAVALAPFTGGYSLSLVPALAKGGIVPHATTALIGEKGKEAVLPLENNTEWMDMLADRILMRSGNINIGGGNTEVVLEIDGREFGRAVVEQGNKENRRIGTRLVIA